MSGKKRTTGLEARMRAYEAVSKTTLVRRTPVIIRIDGRAFHTFTSGFQKPFDRVLMQAMQDTMKKLAENIEGCKFGYTQSDEITLILKDYETIKTGAWFDYEVEKMVSISASMATLYFNRAFAKRVDEYAQQVGDDEKAKRQLSVYKFAMGVGAMFDSRAFSVPKDDVCNNLIFRQRDATRNSIEMVGQAYFSQSELNGVNTDKIQDMLFTQKGVNWNDFPTDCKRGSCTYRVHMESTVPNPRNPEEMVTVSRNPWILDTEPPIFTRDRDFIEKYL